MKPTDQQAAIVDAARTGDNLIVEAGAGTGKTSTLRLLAADRPNKRGLYLAYNKSTAVEAVASFAPNMSCPRVQIGGDFPEPKVDEHGNEKDITREDAMLAYVAVTRARHQLDTGSLNWINNQPAVAL